MRLEDPPVRTGDCSTETLRDDDPHRWPVDTTLDVIVLIAFTVLGLSAIFIAIYICYCLFFLLQMWITGAGA